MTTAHYHALDAQLAKAGAPADPVSLDVSRPEPVECSLCGGCGKVREEEGELLPARWVSAGGGDTVRSGERCPNCLGAGVVEPAAALDALVDETRDAIIANDDIRALRATDELRALAHRMRGAL